MRDPLAEIASKADDVFLLTVAVTLPLLTTMVTFLMLVLSRLQNHLEHLAAAGSLKPLKISGQDRITENHDAGPVSVLELMDPAAPAPASAV